MSEYERGGPLPTNRGAEPVAWIDPDECTLVRRGGVWYCGRAHRHGTAGMELVGWANQRFSTR